ncbi:TrkH family potassium uptake protein [Sinisalibacter aestuarii]|uniref:Trk system potassium uptake protein n=1 Tax=Sinisalibacter aestuarii TaxID=2949426 RepID=A0ABQ5LWJ5_9RHOB|nr:TrkH family potassium uptake protein [Sinisalibacter aestuarii]GKY88765.1 Trk system potassium uptake protein [Sinisalibacter aestuarii]
MSIVIFVNGAVILFAAVLMAADAALFPATAGVFLTAAVLAGAVGLFVMIATRSAKARLDRLHAFLLTASIWLVAGLVGALPLWVWALDPVDAIFEAMSGITTTGSTVMSGLDDTPRGILFWRALLQLLGGVGFVVTGMALLPMLRVGGMQLYRTESSEKGEKELRTAAAYALATLTIYLGLVLLAAITYWAGGMSPFDATTHAMTTLSTGGYSNYDASFGHFTSPFLQWSATLFMLAGGLPFVWYIRVYTRRTFHSEQVTAFLGSVAVVILLLTVWLAWADAVPLAVALRLVAFNVVSVVTTTGYATADYLTWGPVFAVAFFVLTPVGGCTGSTAGGAKAMRWLILFRAVKDRVRAINLPHGVFVTRYEGRAVSDDVLSGVVSFFFFYVLTVGVVAIILDFEGLDTLTALSAALTAVANVGPGVGEIVGPAGNFATLPDFAKSVLAFAMYAGRLEMLTVFVLFTPAFWRAL